MHHCTNSMNVGQDADHVNYESTSQIRAHRLSMGSGFAYVIDPGSDLVLLEF